jgi:hypothetical protein
MVVLAQQRILARLLDVRLDIGERRHCAVAAAGGGGGGRVGGGGGPEGWRLGAA